MAGHLTYMQVTGFSDNFFIDQIFMNCANRGNIEVSSLEVFSTGSVGTKIGLEGP